MNKDVCVYHPSEVVAGQCVDCGSHFCPECDIEIVRHGHVCLDCGARFAQKKIVQAYVATAIGLLFGLTIAIQAAKANQWGFAIAAPLIYAYFFPATFFGWHYGGKIWKTLGSIPDHFEGLAGLFATLFFLAVRLWIAVMLGVLGGGIRQYFNYRNILSARKTVAEPAHNLQLKEENRMAHRICDNCGHKRDVSGGQDM